MNHYCLYACSDALQINRSALEFVRLIQGLSRLLGTRLTHIAYSYGENTKDHVFREGHINQANLSTFNKILAQEKLTGLLLWCDPDISGQPSNLYLDVELRTMGQVDNYRYACIHFPIELIETMPFAANFSFTSELLRSLNLAGKLDYALVSLMEASTPPPYFRGIFAPGLTEQEELNLATWNRRYAERKIRLRGLYWGNLMSASHLARIPDRRELEKRLDNIEGCLRTTINGDDLFFMLPSADLSRSNIAPLETFLRDHDLLIEPDDEARQTVRSLRY